MSNTIAQDDALAPDMVPKLIMIAKSMRALNGLKLASLGFHNGQDELLMLVGSEGISTSVLADRLSVRPSTVSKMMDRLAEKGLVKRSEDPRDKRRTIVRITQAGTEACKELSKARRELEDDLAMSLPLERRSAVIASLAECQTHLASRLKRIR